MLTRCGVIVLIALLGADVLAQSPPPGKLNGTVIDTSDKVMPGVTIALREPESRSVVTDRNGAFAFTALPPGDYDLRASLVGFSTIVQTLTVSENTDPVKIRMRVARGSDAEIIFIANGQMMMMGTVRDARAPRCQAFMSKLRAPSS